tara:strand:+ start:289 stop:615 length:327 start_codon:yes stop_codon:yes gene_type:complete
MFKELIDDAKKNAPDVYTELSLDEVDYNEINFYSEHCTFYHPSLDIDYLDLDHVESVVDYLLREFYENPNSVQAKNVKEFSNRWRLDVVSLCWDGSRRMNANTPTYKR